jgi:hypothetical protein
MAHSDQPATTTPPVFDPYAHPHPAQQPAAYQFPAPVAPPSAPEPTQADAYAPTAWGASTEEFTAPSGQRCLLRKPDIAKPIPAEERVAGAAYIDYVDFVDKVAIFSKAMSGLKVAEPFRPGSAELSERVANVAGAQVPTESAL